ncbi:hypothetical protein Mycsm_05347 [Mycobacterium sp. JS623]|nr:hypothetical protein Mycsm_05347 [Mycobacterium sp. JS623]
MADRVGAHRYVLQMSVRRVARVTLSAVGHEWRVDWTEVRNGKADHLTKTHYTEAAARRHVQGLLEMRISGLTVDSVYTEQT